MTISGDSLRGKLTSHTRRDFIRGIAAAGASTAGAAAAGGGGLHLFAEQALAGGHSHFGDFDAIAASSSDAFEVPPGYRADVVISWGDVFRGAGNKALRYGFNNDFLAYFPLRGSQEGLLFVNHEYPDPFFLHGYKPDGSPKTPAQVQEEQDSVGNSILHVKRRRGGGWKVVSPSHFIFDKAGNLWVVTDISSGSLNKANEYAYHKNNAMFFVPTSGPNKGIAFRFANGPVECELTGPYFTPDGRNLFVNVQHPGELTGDASDAPGIFGQEATYESWWPEGNRATADNPATPKPSTVVITRE